MTVSATGSMPETASMMVWTEARSSPSAAWLEPSTAMEKSRSSAGIFSRSTASACSLCAVTSTRLPWATRWLTRFAIVWLLPVPGGPCTVTPRERASLTAMRSCSSFVGNGMSSRSPIASQPSSSAPPFSRSPSPPAAVPLSSSATIAANASAKVSASASTWRSSV